jgi:hypothetical protein
MRVFAASLVASTIAAAAIFTACGNDSFSAAPADAAPADAFVGDAPVALDAANSSDASSTDPCTNGLPHTICDDFDQTTLSPIWQPESLCTTPALDNTLSLSPPQSLSALSTTGGSGCSSITAAVGVASTRHLACAFDVDFGATLPPFYVEFFKTTLGLPNATYYQVALGLNGPQVYIEEDEILSDGGDPNGTTMIPIDPSGISGKWVHVTFDVNLFTGEATAKVGNGTARRNLQSVPDGGAPATTAQIRVGVAYTPGDAGTVSVNYDNVACDLL